MTLTDEAKTTKLHVRKEGKVITALAVRVEGGLLKDK